jgi:hypothetical protein
VVRVREHEVGFRVLRVATRTLLEPPYVVEHDPVVTKRRLEDREEPHLGTAPIEADRGRVHPCHRQEYRRRAERSGKHSPR